MTPDPRVKTLASLPTGTGPGGQILECAHWLVLGGWLGSWLFFALGVAPTAFRVLESAREGGALVGPLLGLLHLYGVVAGLVLATIAWATGRERSLVALPLVLAALCAGSEWGITGQMEGIRPHELSGSGDPVGAERFARLHRASRALFGVVLLGILLLVPLHVRSRALRS